MMRKPLTSSWLVLILLRPTERPRGTSEVEQVTPGCLLPLPQYNSPRVDFFRHEKYALPNGVRRLMDILVG
ncbi:uncharacterized protein F4812DRAFT_429698 [Daldinia caldariorum]|uniref:uncharacterized protein n=1 Tax=Daldinia caldariorum TaxID=326644 RepID=UPI00200776BA|nr:uncharacterized protein F4812DRAFT_429698 [Daldinia caldariorum]KAI1467477.1 hypothetical protein F4812DRAFT_429698 [Daldinia caldariorum]